MAFATIFFTTALIGVAIYYLVQWLDDKARSDITQRNVPYIPLNNSLLSVLRKERTELTKDKIIQEKGIKTFGFKMMMTNTILCAEPEIAQLVFSKEFTNFTNRRDIKITDPIFGSFLSAALDDQWKRLRSIVTPTFSAGSLRRVKPRIDETVHTLLSNFEDACKESSDVDVKRLYGGFTMDTIIQVAFGTKVDSLNDPNNPVILHARRVFSSDLSIKQFVPILIMLAFPKLANLLGLRIQGETMNFFQGFSEKIIQQRKEELKKNELQGKGSSFIELILEAEAEFEHQETESRSVNGSSPSGLKKKFMTTDETIAQCVLFFLAGYDTTATAISTACYSLALHPDVQEKLYDEIQSVLKKLANEPGNENKNAVELVTTETLPRFEYLSGVISETLRLYAPAQMTERTAAKDIVLETEDGSVRIDLKKGDVMHIPIYSMHRDPKQFPDPEAFKPERFIGEQTFHKYSYLPFGAGPRNCVAKSLALLEVKLALLHTVRVFKFSRSDKTKVPFEMHYQNNFVVPKDIVLKIEKRNSS